MVVSRSFSSCAILGYTSYSIIFSIYFNRYYFESNVLTASLRLASYIRVPAVSSKTDNNSSGRIYKRD